MSTRPKHGWYATRPSLLLTLWVWMGGVVCCVGGWGVGGGGAGRGRGSPLAVPSRRSCSWRWTRAKTVSAMAPCLCALALLVGSLGSLVYRGEVVWAAY